MKLKLILAIILLPFLAFGATTNEDDSVRINLSLTDKGTIMVDPLGTTIPSGKVHAILTNQVQGVVFLADVYGATNTPTFVGRRARGTQASPTAVQTDNTLAAFNSRGYGTTGFSASSRASIQGVAAQNWTDANQGAYITFSTTSNNTSVINEAMRILDTGNIGIGTTTASEKLAVNGNTLITGHLGINTNTAPTGNQVVLIRSAADGTQAQLFLESDNGGSKYRLGSSSTGYEIVDDTVDVYFQSYGSFGGSVFFYRNGTQMMTFSGSTVTMNAATTFSGTSTHTGTATFNGVSVFNAAETNNAPIFSISSITASNLVSTTTDGISYVNSGTNTLLRLIVNGAAGTLQTEALLTSRTNTLTGSPVIQQIYTNNAMRLFTQTGIVLPTALTSISSAQFWTVRGAITTPGQIVSSSAGFAGAITNSCGGFVDPNALYWWSNMVTTAGTPSIAPNTHNETRF